MGSTVIIIIGAYLLIGAGLYLGLRLVFPLAQLNRDKEILAVAAAFWPVTLFIWIAAVCSGNKRGS